MSSEKEKSGLERIEEMKNKGYCLVFEGKSVAIGLPTDKSAQNQEIHDLIFGLLIMLQRTNLRQEAIGQAKFQRSKTALLKKD